MSLLDQLSDPAVWEAFCDYKSSLACPTYFLKSLRTMIDEKTYLPVCDGISRGERFALPKKAVISKLSSEKKRVVYTYPPAENTVTKLLTYLLLRKYDHLFSHCLYSFRPGKTAKDAVRRLIRTSGIHEMFAYKVDIHDYFNSIPIPQLIPMLETVLTDDPPLFSFLRSLLEEEEVIDQGRQITEQKGIMAGTPLSSFYANLYLRDLDLSFENRSIPYARYSDDIIVFGKSLEEVRDYASEIRSFLADKGLSVNPKKESYFSPGEPWVFLGFVIDGKTVDIAPATITKLKQKMRRKTRALARWKKRNDQSGERAAKAFIRLFNRKLLENARDHELTWSNWFFSMINTTSSLQEIDHYAQECIRYLLSDTHTKARFRVKYEEIKKLGYRNLVHAYYDYQRIEENHGR